MKIPKTPFEAICIKEFNTKRQPDGHWLTWGCFELLRIYKFKFDKESLVVAVKDVSDLSGFEVNKYFGGFYIATTREESLPSRPYFFDHFRILK